MKIIVRFISRTRPGEQVEDLRLDGNIERGHRLVGDDDFGLEGQRTGDGDALRWPPGKFVRVLAHEARGESDLRHEVGDPAGNLRSRYHRMHAQRFSECVEHGHARIERGERILEHHLQVATDRHDFGRRAGREVFAA